MHPIWFIIWVWEKAWSADGLLPLLEHNQGALSLAALSLALWAFVEETKRANVARQEALQGEMASRAAREDAERREREFALELSAAEARRAAEMAAQTERRAKAIERQREGAKAMTFGYAVTSITMRMTEALTRDPQLSGDGHAKFEPTAHKALTDAIAALNDFMKAAPLDADVILAVRDLALAIKPPAELGDEMRPIADFDAVNERALAAVYLAEDRLVTACEDLAWMIETEPDVSTLEEGD